MHSAGALGHEWSCISSRWCGVACSCRCAAARPPGRVSPSADPVHLLPLLPCCVQPITKDELASIAGPATMHAVGHVAANLSFAAVAISLTHTVKTLEPAFNVVLSQVRRCPAGAEVAMS